MQPQAFNDYDQSDAKYIFWIKYNKIVINCEALLAGTFI